MKKEVKISFVLILAILLIGSVGAANYCCERTTAGAWCQNVNDDAQCNPSYRTITSYCDATSYCKKGTCINQQEGTCMPSTESACVANNGYWSDKEKSELPQCQLGCCLIGGQAAFTTQIACNRMALIYPTLSTSSIEFQASIKNELICLASANTGAKGACVYTKNYLKTCELTTKKGCQDKQKISGLADVEFHQGFLCSAQDLETNCAKTRNTKCEGDDVYFIDSCGNLANIYDSSKADDEAYWTYIAGMKEGVNADCGDGSGNKDSASCGDCDYYSGSMCKEGSTTTYGNYFCKSLDCKDYRGFYTGGTDGIADANNYPKHGESWCAMDNENTDDLDAPGAVYFKLVCYNGEVTNEECESTRQKICAQTNIGSSDNPFYSGACRVNRWQTCANQTIETECIDTNTRDCVWDLGENETTGKNYHFSSEYGVTNIDDEGATGICTPKYKPGFNRNEEENVIGGEICGIASSICVVNYSAGAIKPLAGGYSMKELKEVLDKKIGERTAEEIGLLKKHCENYCNESSISIHFTTEEALAYKLECKKNCECLKSAWNIATGTGESERINKICTSIGDCGTKKNWINEYGYSYSDIIQNKLFEEETNETT